MNKIKLLLLLITISNCLNANHLIGGYATYRILEIDTLNDETEIEFTFRLYRNLNNTGATLDRVIEMGIFQVMNDSTGEYSVFESFGIGLESVNVVDLGINNVSIEFGDYIFRTRLEHGSDYLLSFQRCCRPETITNLAIDEPFGFAIQLELTSQALNTPIESPRIEGHPLSIHLLGNALDYEIPLIYSDTLEVMTHLASILSAGAVHPDNIQDCCDCVIPNPRNCLPPYDMAVYNSSYSGTNPFGDFNDILYEDNLFSGEFNIGGKFQYGIKINTYLSGELLSRQLVDHTLDVLTFTSTNERAENNIRMYPNPITDHIYIENAEGYNYQLVDLSGKIVSEGITQKKLNMPNLRGLYYLRIYSNEVESVQKLVLNTK